MRWSTSWPGLDWVAKQRPGDPLIGGRVRELCAFFALSVGTNPALTLHRVP
ncbi:hypothetical protein [Kribbella sp. VKM Ac-2568]|uniref:hypothetical protein n=1 Tax=Kribbella sp. VKM Ac-2568 TaxID=2512219 RepID=UPI0010D17E4E|nr:hypothetical protein [Kribbella sp. VKM Ac-2568]TCM49984.1 hypothetical protein EV648_10224 [Kribbella sp. VKM Ac-2568]